jgi:hypothetical protein
MNTQRINIGNIVRSILLIVIGIGVGISIGIGIGRIGNAPSSVSKRVGQFGRQLVVCDLGSRDLSFKVLAGRTVHVARLNAAAVDHAAAEVVPVNSNDVRDNDLLI